MVGDPPDEDPFSTTGFENPRAGYFTANTTLFRCTLAQVSTETSINHGL